MHKAGRCEDNVNGSRELFLCDSCRQGYHYECVLRMGWEDECDGMLDANEVWRCRTCITRKNFAVSSLLGGLVDDKGEETLLIRRYSLRPMGTPEGEQRGSCDQWHPWPWTVQARRRTVRQCRILRLALRQASAATMQGCMRTYTNGSRPELREGQARCH